MTENKELAQQARDFAARDLDLYALLEVDATATKENVHRAWKRQTLKYHPDRTRDAFDPAKYELFELARNVLCDTLARDVYDRARSAALLRRAEREAVQGKRRAMLDELEAAEREHKRAKLAEEERARELEREKARLAEEGRRRREAENEAFRRAQLESQRREQKPDELDERIVELERQIAENRRLKAERKAAKKGRKGGETDKVGMENGHVPDGEATRPAPASVTGEEKPAAETAGTKPPPKWADLKARMIAKQREKEARKAQENGEGRPQEATSEAMA